MGVEYQPLVLPKRRTFVPTSRQFAALVERLRESGWARSVRGSHVVHKLHRTVALDAALEIRRGAPLPVPFTESLVDGLRQPNAKDAIHDELRVTLSVDRGDDDEDAEDLPRILMVDHEHPLGYSIDVYLARDFVRKWGNNVNDAEPLCACGANLCYEARDVWAACLDDHIHATCPACARAYDPKHASHLSHVGVSIDFGKDWPVLPEGQPLELAPELVALCESALEERCETVHLFT